ncbi:hypothetical protein Dsin_023235 [Dipteronia sinensis]|uniref:Uncharacterized protein n=1 Tax=Dipteronia sinensis TaxID=43782 RepID=A0AAE0A3K2_9ROSI|nr:hypothetical protein Dsin_023235 [Dipteronia sinensis]
MGLRGPVEPVDSVPVVVDVRDVRDRRPGAFPLLTRLQQLRRKTRAAVRLGGAAVAQLRRDSLLRMPLKRSLKLLSIFVLPCFLVEAAYKIWWYASGASRIPFLGNVYLSDIVACIMELCSWLYRTTVIFLVCVLFRLICHLQILRLQDFAKFILWALIMITGSQFASLLMTTKPHAVVNIYRAGELALCSMTLVTALLMLLRSATKITHKAQGVTCLAAKWHVCATLDSFEANESEVPRAPAVTARVFPSSHEDSDGDDAGDEEDDLDNSKLIPAYAYSTISFQKRQALGMNVTL